MGKITGVKIGCTESYVLPEFESSTENYILYLIHYSIILGNTYSIKEEYLQVNEFSGQIVIPKQNFYVLTFGKNIVKKKLFPCLVQKYRRKGNEKHFISIIKLFHTQPVYIFCELIQLN